MEKFTIHTGLVAPLDIANVDTDQIIPKQFLQKTERVGFGKHLFHDSRYLDHSGKEPNPEFILNKPQYQGTSILLARENFGCGSSREHAPWALEEFGFKVIIAPSFADIFFNNSFKNGLLPIILDADIVEQLFQEMYANEGYELSIDLATQSVSTPSGESFSFEVDEFRKHCLLNGLDDIGLTLQDADAIRSYETQRKQQAPWLFGAIQPE